MNSPELNLITLAIQGNQQAFNQLAEHYYKDLFQYCLHYLKDYDLAQEASQETLIRIHKHISSLQNSLAFSSWIQKIAENCCKDIISLKSKPEKTEDITYVKTNGENLEDSFINQALQNEFLSILSGLSKKLRDVLFLYYTQKHPLESVAQYLDIAPETARKRLFDAHRSLAKKLKINQEEISVMLSGLSRLNHVSLFSTLMALNCNQEFKVFEDNFENGIDTKIWESVAGTPAITDNLAHSGKYSYHIKKDHWDMIRVNLGGRNVGEVGVWIFDSGEPLAIMATVNVTQGGAVDTNARIGIFEERSPKHYHFQADDRGNHIRISTPIPRSNGWHHFQFTVDGKMTRAFVDGQLAGETALVPCFSHFYVGDGWEAEGAEGFVDDVKIVYKPAFEE